MNEEAHSSHNVHVKKPIVYTVPNSLEEIIQIGTASNSFFKTSWIIIKFYQCITSEALKVHNFPNFINSLTQTFVLCQNRQINIDIREKNRKKLPHTFSLEIVDKIASLKAVFEQKKKDFKLWDPLRSLGKLSIFFIMLLRNQIF